MTIIGIEDVNELRVLVALAVDDNSLEIDLTLVDVVVNHHQCEKVVGRASEVRVENHLDGLVLGLLRLIRSQLVHCLCLASSEHQRQRHSHHQVSAKVNGGF